MNLEEALKIQNSGNYPLARKAYRAVLANGLDGKERAEALNGAALCELALGNHSLAYDWLNEALEITPDRWDFRLHIAQAATRLKLDKEAMNHAREAAKLSNDPRVWVVYANTCKYAHDNNAALIALQHLHKLDPLNPSVPLAMGEIYYTRGDYVSAEKWYRKSCDLNPNDPNTYFYLSSIYSRKGGCNKELYECAEKATHSSDPVKARLSRWNLALCQLAQGKYLEGWEGYETRHGFDLLMADLAYPMKRFAKPIWAGQENVKVHVQPEQGFGDTLMFVRYVRDLEAKGCQVTLETHAQMLNLMKNSFPNAKVVSKSDDWPKTGGLDLDFDYHIPIMSLPYAFKTVLETIPHKTPYIHAEPAKIAKWAHKFRDMKGLKVGLCWAGEKRAHDEGMWLHDEARSMRFDNLKPILDIPSISFVSLQMGEPGRQATGIHDFTDDIWDWSDTAAMVHHLDIVISVCTSIAHLAGGMDKKTYVLNKYDACWRWLLDREDSPWYPRSTLIRQPSPNDWESVICRLKEKLEQDAKPAA
jgi:Flp pilus assembly protein TadD